ncbi:MAG: signal peptidase I [Hyphomonadaceae bacterium]
MATDESSAPFMRKAREELIDWARTLAWIVPIWLLVITLFYSNYSIPSESMVPTLEVGDRVIVSQSAYGYSRYSLPLNLGRLVPPGDKRLFERMPERGDVVVFMNPHENRVMIKRLVGLPGDRIAVRAGRLWINDAPVPLSPGTPLLRRAHDAGVEAAVRYEETLPGGLRHPIDQFPNVMNPLDEFGPIVVPPRHFFFMGDNRDNSLDSRAEMGPVPFENLIGRAETIYFTWSFCNPDAGYACPRKRWLKPLHD